MFWKWATVVGLAMTPALIAGQSAAAAAGIAWGFDPWVMLPVIMVSGYVEGVAVAWLAGASQRVGFIGRQVQKLHKPSAVAWANKWGPWGGLFLGVAAVGQEPVLVALRWLDVPLRRLLLPLALSNIVFSLVYYAIVKAGWAMLG